MAFSIGKENLAPFDEPMQIEGLCGADDGLFTRDDLSRAGAALKPTNTNVLQPSQRRKVFQQWVSGEDGDDDMQMDDMPPPPRAFTRPAPAAAAPARQRNKAAKISVSVRIRPPAQSEIDAETPVALQVEDNTVMVKEPRTRVDGSTYTDRQIFNRFDNVFDHRHDNLTVYENTAQPLIDVVFEGGWATCFAYGQTGTGKTHTMLGKDSKGLYALAADEIFSRLGNDQHCNCNYYEVYGNKCFDLLQRRQQCEIREDKQGHVNICGLTDHQVSCVEELLQLIETGSAVRAQGATSANVGSSRSHAVLTISVYTVPAPMCRAQKPGRFSFIDLAGTERGSDAAGSDKTTRQEGAEINKTLLQLKECIRALGGGQKHIPFRGSKLTCILKESFVGKSRTCMIACVAPCVSNCEDTLNTLRYADTVADFKVAGRRTVHEGYDPTTMMRTVSRPGSNPSGPRATRSAAKRPAPAAPDLTTPLTARPSAAPRPSVQPRPPFQALPQEMPAAPLCQPEHHIAQPPAAQEPLFTPGADVSLDDLHARLVTQCVEEEEELLVAHRNHIDEVMEITREEMAELNAVNQPGSSIEEYVQRLDTLLKAKMGKIVHLQKKLTSLQTTLREEQQLTRTAGH
eukprot:TRINITY_DN36250_c0_g1_i1.p1 TRINITY_DN36250_c0_g1~~TRINITY_DN36250_c0_g1_i1.p1  ORF type:complete len:645 (+),score=206.58 TRINITY_DN36250_c0_g1_i1:53-1936(+)